MSSEAGPPTPGVDDTPYIRFAIDQLTRDEEVRGSRRYPFPVDPRGSIATAPGNPFEDPDTGYVGRRDDDNNQHGPAASRQPLRLQTPEPAAAVERDSLPTVARPSYVPDTPATPAQPEVFVPFDHDVPSLHFIPSILRPVMLSFYTLLLLLMLVALLFSGIWSGRYAGLFEYNTFGGSRYFVFEYLPSICGIFMLVWLFQIQVAVQRVAPFIAMASMSATSRSQGPLMELQPTGFLFPKLLYFRARQPLIGICMIIFWLQIITVPLLTCVYNVYFYGQSGTGSWRWETVQGVVWTLFALYLLQTVAILTLGIWINRQRTGLRWDVRSIADLMALLERSNVRSNYAGSETFATPKAFEQRLAARSDRLGFWHTSNQPLEPFYALGEEGAETRRYSLDRGRIREKDIAERSSFTPDTPTTPGAADQIHDIESGEGFARVRHRYLPWLLKPSMVWIWTIAAIALYLAFLIVSFINRAVVHGFAPLTHVAPTPAGFSATNFTYSFIPALIAQFLFLAWLSIDYAFRRLQPYAAMSIRPEHGAKASDSVLLDYPARLPFSVTLAALVGKDFRIAWFSLLSLISATLPILAGGCFWAQFYVSDQQVRVAVDPPAYYALCTFLALYAFTIPLLFIGLRQYKLPHAVTTVAEQMSFLYQSNLLSEKRWRAAIGSKPELVSRLITATNSMEQSHGNEGRFSFGRFLGKDGKTHLGIERAGGRRSMSDRYTRRLGMPSGQVRASEETTDAKSPSPPPVPARTRPIIEPTPARAGRSFEETVDRALNARRQL